MAERARVRVGEDDGRVVLLVDGVVQSVALADGLPGGYWERLLPDVRPRRALLLGLGGGTVAHLLWRRFGPLPIVGVEVDPDVVALGRSDFGLARPELELVEQDALAYAASCRERFDYVCVDLYRGPRFERGVLARPFLRALAGLANPGAEISFNLFYDRRVGRAVERIRRVLTVRSVERIGLNVVVRTSRR